MIKELGCALALITLGGCGLLTQKPGASQGGKADDLDPIALSRTIGEAESGYTYVPIDPFPVEAKLGANCLLLPGDKRPRTAFQELLPSLPDNAVRMLVEKFDASGNVSYGVMKAGAMNESFRVTVDYINADTINQRVAIQKFMVIEGNRVRVPLTGQPPINAVPGSESFQVEPLRSYDFYYYRSANEELVTSSGKPLTWQDPDIFNIPVYVGLGLRVSANIYVIGASANISGLGVIGAEAEDEKLRGSLVVQTLGVNGKSVTAALPIQSELNRTTAQNAIAAVGTLKALLYADETVKSPRVVGMYLPFTGGKPLVNALISALSTARIEWPRSCKDPTNEELARFEKDAMALEKRSAEEDAEIQRQLQKPNT